MLALKKRVFHKGEMRGNGFDIIFVWQFMCTLTLINRVWPFVALIKRI